MANPIIRKIPGHDYKSDYYVMKKPPLVIFLAQDHPMMTFFDVDMELLDEFFTEQCHNLPEVMHLVNKPHDEIRQRFAEIEGSKYDAFFFIFLSCMCTGCDKQRKPCIKVECYDRAVPIEEFMNMVKGRPDMALKPKIFFFQADDRHPPWLIKEGVPENVILRSVEVPTYADQLMLFSSFPHYLPSLPPKFFLGAEPTASTSGEVVSQPTDGQEKTTVKQDHSLLIKAFVEVLKSNKDTDVFCCTPLISGKVDEMKASLDLGYYREEHNVYFFSSLTNKIKFYDERDIPFGL